MSRLTFYFCLVCIPFLISCSPDSPSSIEEFVQQGDRQVRSGNLLAAIGSYRMALHQDTLNPVVLGRLSRVYATRGNSSAADRYARRAANIFYERGGAFLHAGDQSSALAAYEQTLELFPNHPLALNRLGEIYLARGEEDLALERFEKSVEINPRFAETFIKLGDLHLSRGDLEKAQVAFEKALEENINASKAYLGLGQICLQREDWQAAVSAYKNALLVHPDSPEALAGLKRAQRHL